MFNKKIQKLLLDVDHVSSNSIFRNSYILLHVKYRTWKDHKSSVKNVIYAINRRSKFGKTECTKRVFYVNSNVEIYLEVSVVENR